MSATFFDRDLMADCVSAAGYLNGSKLAIFILLWGQAERDIGHRVGIEEFGEWCEHQTLSTTRTAYRKLALFRSAFPQLGDQATPGDLVRITLDDTVEWAGLPAS